ncbi:cell wall-active antibiotics response protein, partial [Frankia sp. AiPs1]|uniref:LiaF domain-containing protein n=1 Tax=Frankia sp. AiPs1 TaxID=573493 RepID=UPI002043BE6A
SARRGPTGVDWTVAVMSGNERTGRWRPSRHTRAVAVMGGCELDLREIAFPTDALMITAVAVMGGIEIIVPEGVEVEVTGVSIMGGRSVKVAATPRRPGMPVVRIRAIAVMGGVEVRSKPPRPTTAAGHPAIGPTETGPGEERG